MRNLKKQIQKEAEEVSEALLSFVTIFRFPKLKLRNSIILKFALAFLLLFTNPAGTTSFTDSLNGASAMVHEMTPEQKQEQEQEEGGQLKGQQIHFVPAG